MKGIFGDFISNLSVKNDIPCQFFRLRPFPLALFQNVLLNEGPKLWDFSELILNRKESDLYSLFQSAEVTDMNIRKIFLDFFCSCKTKGLKFNGIYLSSLVYKGGSFLLCHDDQLDDRIFAFVFYLSDVSHSDGGLLDFFEDSYNNVPNTISFSLIPKKYSLILFEVSLRSFHQVSEYINNITTRNSIGGWIRGEYVIPSGTLPHEKFLETLEADLGKSCDYHLVIEPDGMFFYTSFNPESELYFSFDIYLIDPECFIFRQNFQEKIDFLIYSADNRDLSLLRFRNSSFIAITDKVSKIVFATDFSIVPGDHQFFLLKGYKR
jgi:hypothetical protein